MSTWPDASIIGQVKIDGSAMHQSMVNAGSKAGAGATVDARFSIWKSRVKAATRGGAISRLTLVFWARRLVTAHGVTEIPYTMMFIINRPILHEAFSSDHTPSVFWERWIAGAYFAYRSLLDEAFTACAACERDARILIVGGAASAARRELGERGIVDDPHDVHRLIVNGASWLGRLSAGCEENEGNNSNDMVCVHCTILSNRVVLRLGGIAAHRAGFIYALDASSTRLLTTRTVVHAEFRADCGLGKEGQVMHS